MQHMFELGRAEYGLWLSRDVDGYTLRLGDGGTSVALAGGRLRIDGIEMPVHIAHDGDRLFIHVDGDAHELLYRDPVSYYAAGAESGLQDVLRAPMPGVVVSLSVEEGQHVEEGDLLLVIESMKLEVAIRAPRTGIVETLHVAPSNGFERDAALVSLAPL